MGHGANTPDRGDSGDSAPSSRLTADNAQTVAATLQALATPSRLLILARLREGPCPATELAEAVGMQQSACSHQLRLLRNLGLVTGTRQGRSIVYALHDNHVAELLDQALHHVEHLRLGMPDAASETGATDADAADAGAVGAGPAGAGAARYGVAAASG